MSLTMPPGPLSGSTPAEVNYRIDGPAHRLFAHRFPRRVRARFAERFVLDTTCGLLLHETGLLPVLYVPTDDVATALLEPTDRHTHCPFKGDASYWSVRVGEAVADNAAWGYPEPRPESAWLAGHLAFYWSAMDAWFDEEEQVFGHLRDPYHRVDARRSSLSVRVRHGDTVLAASDRPMLLSETGLPNRYYLPADDVRGELLVDSDTHTVCPYKGTASYRSLPGADPVTDAAWYYPEPLPDATAIAGHLCFDPAKVTVDVAR